MYVFGDFVIIIIIIIVIIIAGYQLEKKTPFGNWEKVSETPIIGESATVPDLVEGEEYEYRVAAVTDAGVGDYSNATPPVKAERKKRKTTHGAIVSLRRHSGALLKRERPP